MSRPRRFWKIALYALLVIFFISLPSIPLGPIPNRSGTIASNSQVNILPIRPKPQIDLGFFQPVLNWVQNVIDSAPHYGYWLPSNVPDVWATSNFGITTMGSTSYPTTKSGDTNTESTNQSPTAAYIEAYDKFTSTVPFTISTVSIYQNVSGASHHMHFGLYGDSGGSPASQALVAGSDSGQITLNTNTGSFQTYTFANPFYLAAGTYWITELSDATITNFAKVGSTSASLYFKAQAYGALPGTFPSGPSSTTGPVSIYVTGVQIEGYTKGSRVQYTDATGSLVTSFSFRTETCNSGDHFIVAFYDDSSAIPAHRLWYSNSTTCNSSMWNVVNYASGTTDNGWTGTLTHNAYYWFMWQWNNVDNGPSFCDGAGGDCAVGGANTGIYLAQTFGTLLSSWSGGATNTDNWSEYATYSPVVTLPIQCTMDNGASSVTLTLSGGSPSPATVTCNGSPQNIVVTASTAVTSTEPADSSTDRQRFVANGGGTTISTTSCASGTCSTWAFRNYDQSQVTFTTSGIGGDTTANVAVVNSTSYTQAQLPIAQWWDYNSQASYTFNSPISSTTAGKQYAWSNTGGVSQSLKTNTFNVITGGTVTGTYTTQYDLKIQAVDGYTISQSPQTILKTTQAAMNVTVSGGSTTVLLADANGYMDFGYFNSSQQVYLTAKYVGTVVNSTWHTSLYTINSISVYQWKFEYPVSLTSTVSVVAGSSTGNLKFSFTGYSVSGNSSATFTSGTASASTLSTTSQASISGSSTMLQWSTSLAIYGSGTFTFNVTDGYAFVRTPITMSYVISVSQLASSIPGSWQPEVTQTVSVTYLVNATVGGAGVKIDNVFFELSLLNPSTSAVTYFIDSSTTNATYNVVTTQTLQVMLQLGFSGTYNTRLVLYHYAPTSSRQQLGLSTGNIAVLAQGVIGCVNCQIGTQYYSVASLPIEPQPTVQDGQNYTVQLPIHITGTSTFSLTQVVFYVGNSTVTWIMPGVNLPVSYGTGTVYLPVIIHAPWNQAPGSYLVNVVIYGNPDYPPTIQGSGSFWFVIPSTTQTVQPTVPNNDLQTGVTVLSGVGSVLIIMEYARRHIKLPA